MYGDLTEASVYHAERGNAAWGALTAAQQTAALIRGSDYVDQRYREKLKSGRWLSMFSGVKTGGRDQAREWPRTGATDYEGHEIADDVVPVEVERAAYEAALREAVTPGSLSPDFIPGEQVAKEKVGPVEIAYHQPRLRDGIPPNRPVIPAIDEIIAPVLVARYDYPAVRVV